MKLPMLSLLLLCLLSCQENTSNQNSKLLTEITWHPSQEILFNGEMSNYNYTIRFYPDGNYSLGQEGSSLIGKWTWTEQNEIRVSCTGLTSGDKVLDFPFPTIFEMKVIALNEKEFHFQVKEESDNWNARKLREERYLAY